MQKSSSPLGRCILLCFILLCFPVYLSAQYFVENDEADSLVRHPRPSPILKFSPLSLLDPISSIQFAFEHSIGKKMSFQHEVGYITYIANYYLYDYNYNESKSSRGLRVREEFRHYLNPTPGYHNKFYFAAEFLYIFQRVDKHGRFGMDCNGNDNCNYFQMADYIMQKQVFALHPKMGLQLIVFKRGILDIYGGIGFRHIRVNYLNAPSSVEMREWWNDGLDFRKREGVYNYPGVSGGFKFGYLLFNNKTSGEKKGQISHE